MTTRPLEDQIIGKILRSIGFERCTKQALEEMEWLFSSYWDSISLLCKSLVESNNRTQLSWMDLKASGLLEEWVAMDRTGLLMERAEALIESSELKKRKKKKLKFVKGYTAIHHPTELLPIFPPFPPEHSYLSNKVILLALISLLAYNSS